MKKNDNASASMIAAAVGVLIIIAAGFMIYYQLAGQLNTLPAAANQSAGALNNTTNLILGGLAPIIAIILIAGAAVIAVSGFGKR